MPIIRIQNYTKTNDTWGPNRKEPTESNAILNLLDPEIKKYVKFTL